MRPLLRSLVFLLAVFNIHAVFGQVDTIAGCDEIPNTPQEGLACTICSFETLYGTTFGYTPGADAGWCGTIENDQYIGFVAGPTGAVTFEITTFNCTNGDGVQVAIYDDANSLVGNCFNQVFPNQPQIFTGGGLTPGSIYYIRIDGFAGDNCEFNITVISGLSSVPPGAPGPIMGPRRVCWDDSYSWFIDMVPNATSYYWRITPGAWTASIEVDPEEATNPLEGTTDLAIEITMPELPIAMPRGTCDTVLLEVFPLNTCFPGTDSSVFEFIVCRPDAQLDSLPVCINGEVEYPPGSGEFYTYSPIDREVVIGVDRFGCDTTAILRTTLENGIFIQDSVVLCEGEVFEGCGFPDPSVGPGITNCTVPSNQPGGCDTIFVWYVYELDPAAHIEATNGTISCTNTSDDLYAVTRTGGTPPSSAGDTVSYQWFDASNTLLGTGETVNVTEPGTYTLEVTMTSNIDPSKTCSATTTITITDTRTAPNPPTVAGDFDVCADEVPQVYTASGATGTDQYLWTVVPATGATTSSTGGTLTVTDFGGLGSLTVCAQTFNACDTSASTCEIITVNPLPTAATLTGPTELCQGATGTFAIGGYDANLTYTISSTPTGATATVNGSNIDFTMGSASGDVCLVVSNSCGTLPAVCATITLLPDPVATAPAGPTAVCVGQVEDYTIYGSLPSGTTAAVTVTGGTITVDNGGMITVVWTDAGAQTICVEYTNTCGVSDPACLDVDVSSAGDAIMSGGGEYCESNNDVTVTITFTGAGPYNYTYTLDGVVQTGTSPTSPVVLGSPATGDYVLTGFTVGSCAGTVAGTATVTELAEPTAALSGGGTICTGADTTLTINFSGDGPWTFEHSLGGAGQGTTTTNDNPYLLTVSAAGNYGLVSVRSDNGCVGTVSGSATISILDPIVTGDPGFTCDGTGETYRVSFTVTGGDPANYQVVPAGSGTFSGGVFTSADINSGDGFVFAISDASGCDAVVVDGTHTCPCETMVGNLSTTPIEICGDQTPADVAAGYDASGEVQDDNDTRVYILHTGTGNMIVGAIATNSTGVFLFDPATMTYGTTYYVSVAVGDDDGSGGVDLADDCTQVTTGTPVTFSEEPSATLSGGGDICEGDDTTVQVDFEGSGPWTLGYTVGGDAFTITTSDNPATIDVLGLTDDAIVALTSVTTGACTGDVTGTASIEVQTGITILVEENCTSTFTDYRVTITIQGGDPGTYTVTPPDGTLTGNVFVSNEIPAGTGYAFAVNDQYGCDPQVASAPTVICDCVSDAGTMSQAELTLCGPIDAVAVMPTDTAMDSDDVINFILHDGTSNAVGANVFAQQATPTFSFGAPLVYGTVYYISAVMGNSNGGVTDLNDPCLSVAVGTPVRWLRESTVTIAGNQDVCTDEDVTLNFDVDADGPVTVTYTNGISTNTITLNPGMTDVPGELNESGTYTITAVSSGPCDGQFSGSAVVGVHEPVIATAVPTCNSTSTMYSVEITIDGGDPGSYIVTPANGTLVGNVFTSNLIDADQEYLFTVTDQWGCSPVILQDSVDCNCLTRIGTISDDFVSCDQNETATFVYDNAGEFLDGDDAIEYVLHTGDPTNPLLRSATPSFNFDGVLMTAGTTYFVTAVAGNSTGGTVDLTDDCTVFSNEVSVVWGDPPVVSISGDFTVCPGVPVDLTFDVTGPGDITIVYTDGTSQWIEVLTSGISQVAVPQTGEATYTIVSVNSAACPGTFSGSASVTLLDGPIVTHQIVIDPTGTMYDVILTITGGDPATYTVNGTALNGATTFTETMIPCGTPWTYVVDDAGGCDPFVMTVDPDCNCLSAVGALTGTFESCDETALASFSYDASAENLDGDDALQFALYQTDLSAIIARSATTEFGFDPANMTFGTTYFIVAMVGNAVSGEVDITDGCLAVSPPVTAVWHEQPDASFTAPTALCAGDDLEITFEVTGSASAKTVSFTVDGVAQTLSGLVPGTPGVFTTSATGSVTVVLTGVEDANCSTALNQTASIDVATEVFASLLAETCNPTNTEYVVTFEITGGDAATYQVLPAGSGTISGTNPAVFTSNVIASGTSYDFTVQDASGCFTPVISGLKDCDCETEAGTMVELAQISVCAGDDIEVDFATGSETLDPNDVLWFALRTDNDGVDYTDDVLAVNTTPVFSSVGLDPGTIYYVSPVAADGLMDGSLDNSDGCLDIGLSTPVFIQALPTGELTGDTVICETGTATITLVLVGNGPFDVTIDRGDAGGDTLITGASNGQTYQVDPATGTVYFLSSITDSSIPQCSSEPTSNVTIGVEDLLSAGVAGAPLDLCEGSGDVIALNDQITDGDAGGTWTQSSGPASGSNFDPASATVSNTTLDPGVYLFTYTVGSGFPCPTDDATVEVDIEAGPEANAGLDQEITCDEPVVQLGSDPVAGYTYTWSGGSVEDPSSASTSTSTAGTFVLTVTSGDAECRGVDEVIVTSNDDVPLFDNLLTRDVTCFGDTDGAIFTGVSGGTGPFTYTLDGETTANVGQFTGIAPGEHELQVVDSEGCVYIDTITIEAAKEVIVDAGPDAELTFGDSHEVQLYLEGDVETVRWIGDSIQCISAGDFCDRALLFPQTSGTYAVTVRDSNGCEATDVIQLIVRRERPVYIPNAISPNGDGINDFIFVRAREGIVASINTFRIYDRWGEMVFNQGIVQPNDESGGWDGRFGDEIMNPQVFTYWCEVEYMDGEKEIFKGDITLVAN